MRNGMTLEWFNDPEEADAKDRAFLRSLSPQDRLDLLLDLLRRWAKTDERGFERVIEFAQPPRS